jgi:hypothetical protein
MKAGRRKGRKVGKPRGKTCRWTAELDDVLKIAWGTGRSARRAACYPAAPTTVVLVFGQETRGILKVVPAKGAALDRRG